MLIGSNDNRKSQILILIKKTIPNNQKFKFNFFTVAQLEWFETVGKTDLGYNSVERFHCSYSEVEFSVKWA